MQIYILTFLPFLKSKVSILNRLVMRHIRTFSLVSGSVLPYCSCHHWSSLWSPTKGQFFISGKALQRYKNRNPFPTTPHPSASASFIQTMPSASPHRVWGLGYSYLSDFLSLWGQEWANWSTRDSPPCSKEREVALPHHPCLCRDSLIVTIAPMGIYCVPGAMYTPININFILMTTLWGRS